MLEAAEADIAFADGVFTIAGTDRSVTIEAVARAAFNPGAIAARSRTRFRRERPFHAAGADLSERLSCLRGRDRSRNRADRDRALSRGGRFRHRHQPAAAGGPGAWRDRAGGRAGDARTHGLRPGERAAADRQPDRLCRAARRHAAARSSSRTISCRAAPTRSASRGPARPARSARRRRWSMPSSTPSPSSGIDHLDMPLTPQRLWRALRDADAATRCLRTVMDPLLEIALRAALAGGEAGHAGLCRPVRGDPEGRRTPVTEADLASERAIIAILSRGGSRTSRSSPRRPCRRRGSRRRLRASGASIRSTGPRSSSPATASFRC